MNAPIAIKRRQPTPQSHRLRRAVCEILEERQLMTLTMEIRDLSGGASATVTSVGQVLNLEIVAVVSAGTPGPNDNNISVGNPATYAIQNVTGSVVGTSPYSHAVAGSLAAAVNMNFRGFTYQNGTPQDLNGDGNIDVGSNDATKIAGYFYGHAGSEYSSGTVSNGTNAIVVGTANYTVTSLNDGGETDINFRPRPSGGGYLVANWYDGVQYEANIGQGAFASDAVSTISAGTPFVVTNPALVVAPVAINDTATIVRNLPTSVNVLGNDQTVVALNKTSLVIGTAPTHGTAIPQTDGTVLYTPATGYTGPDSFSYTVDDTGGRVSNSATVSLTVVLPPPPTAGAVSSTTLENQADTINVLSSDSTTSPATLVTTSVIVATAPGHGTAVSQSNGTILYTPTSGYIGSDTFTYTVADTNGETSSPATVTITVNSPTPPTAAGDTGTTTGGAPVTLDVLANDTTPQGTLNVASVTVVTAPLNGTAVAQPDGTIIYTPAAGYVGTDTFHYTVADSLGDVSNAGQVFLTITAAVPPVAGNVTAPVLTGQTGTINVLSNVSSGSPLVPTTVTVVTGPADGTATVNSDGTISYVPKAGFVGTDTFTYTVGNTNHDTSNTASVNVAVGTTISRAKGAAHSLAFTDAAGGAELVMLNSGSAEVFFSGTGGSVTVSKAGKATVVGSQLAISSIALTGTTRSSSLSIRGTAKAPLTIGGITDASPLGSISAATAVLSGTVTLNSVGTLNVQSISGATMTIAAGLPGRFSLTTGAVTDSSLNSAVPITLLRAASWTGASTITAPSIANLLIAGAFDPSVNLTSNGKARAISSARITGALGGGAWTVPGPIGSLTAGSISAAWTATLGSIASMMIRAGGLASAVTAGAVGSLSISGNLTGNITAASARQIRVIGSVNGSTVKVSGALAQLLVTGTITGSSIAAGGLATLTAGAMVGSTVTAGVVTGTTLTSATAADLGSSTIGSIRLTGRTGDQFTNSSILAGKITTASLGSVTTANSGTTIGIAAKSISSFSGVFAGNPLRANRAELANSAVLTAFVKQQGVAFGDFEILVTG